MVAKQFFKERPCTFEGIIAIYNIYLIYFLKNDKKTEKYIKIPNDVTFRDFLFPFFSLPFYNDVIINLDISLCSVTLGIIILCFKYFVTLNELC